MIKKYLLCLFIVLMMPAFCLAQRMVSEEVVVDEYQEMPSPEPASRGYLTEGSTLHMGSRG